MVCTIGVPSILAALTSHRLSNVSPTCRFFRRSELHIHKSLAPEKTALDGGQRSPLIRPFLLSMYLLSNHHEHPLADASLARPSGIQAMLHSVIHVVVCTDAYFRAFGFKVLIVPALWVSATQIPGYIYSSLGLQPAACIPQADLG